MKPTDADRDPAFDRLIARGLEGETDVTGNACPDADLLAAWYDHSLAASEAERIQTHAAGCGVCQQILADLARSEPAVVRAAPVPEPSKPWHWHWRWLVPVATMLVVVIVVGNRTLRAPEPARQAAEALPSKVEEAARQEAARQPEALQPPADVPPQPAATAPTGTPKAERPLRLARGAAPADAARPARVPPSLQVAPLQGEVRADRAEPLAENRAAALPKQAAEGVSGGVVGGVAQLAPPAPAAPPPPPATGFVTPLKTVGMKAASAPPPPSVASARAGRSRGGWGRAGRSNGRRKAAEAGKSSRAASPATCSRRRRPRNRTAGPSAPPASSCAPPTALLGRACRRPVEADLLFVHAASKDAAIVKAADGSEYSTSDGGRTWTRRQ